MRYGNLKKGLFMLVAFTIITMGFTKEAKCQGFATWDEYMEYSKAHDPFSDYTSYSSVAERNAAQGLTNNQSPAKTSQPSEQAEKKVVKTCEHFYEDKIEVEPTCSETGKLVFTCSKCGDSYSSEVEPTGKHDYESKVTKEATCEEDGEKA